MKKKKRRKPKKVDVNGSGYKVCKDYDSDNPECRNCMTVSQTQDNENDVLFKSAFSYAYDNCEKFREMAERNNNSLIV